MLPYDEVSKNERNRLLTYLSEFEISHSWAFLKCQKMNVFIVFFVTVSVAGKFEIM
jgi:hypothetical protein